MTESLIVPQISAAKFKKLPKGKRVVLVAKDIIALLHAKKIRAAHGTYAIPNNLETLYKNRDVSIGCELGAKLVQDSRCTVCAKGAFLVASLLRTNNCTVGEFADFAGWSMAESRLVPDVFTHFEFDTIESAFEADNFFDTDKYDGKYKKRDCDAVARKARKWAKSISDYYYGQASPAFDYRNLSHAEFRMYAVAYSLIATRGVVNIEKFLTPEKVVARMAKEGRL